MCDQARQWEPIERIVMPLFHHHWESGRLQRISTARELGQPLPSLLFEMTTKSLLKNFFKLFAWSKGLMVSRNQDTLTLPNETDRMKPLLLSYTCKIETPSSHPNSKDLDLTRSHLDQSRTKDARKRRKNLTSNLGDQQARMCWHEREREPKGVSRLDCCH